MKSIKFLAVAILVLGAVPAFAQTTIAQADLEVRAQVIPNCTIATTAVDFLTYDVLSATPDDDGVGTITIRCTRGIPNLRVAIDNGLSGVRQMTFGANNLPYQLYQDAARSVVWGTGAAAVDPGVVTPSADTVLSVYGRINAGIDVPVGNYSQIVQAIVQY